MRAGQGMARYSTVGETRIVRSTSWNVNGDTVHTTFYAAGQDVFAARATAAPAQTSQTQSNKDTHHRPGAALLPSSANSRGKQYTSCRCPTHYSTILTKLLSFSAEG